MSPKLNNEADRYASKIFKEIYENWTGSTTGDDGEEISIPENRGQLSHAYWLLEEIDPDMLSDELIREEYNVLREFVDDIKRDWSKDETADDKAVHEIYGVYLSWSHIEGSGDDEKRKPADLEEAENSYERLIEIDSENLEDDSTLHWLFELKTVSLDAILDYRAFDSYDDKAYFILEGIFYSWTLLQHDEEGNLLRFPGSPVQLKESQQRFDLIDLASITTEKTRAKYEQMKEMLDNMHDVIDEEDDDEDNDPDAEATQILQEVFKLWSKKEEEDGEVYHSPANIDEVNQSKQMLDRINPEEIDDADVLERYHELKKIIDDALDANQNNNIDENSDDAKAWQILEDIFESWTLRWEEEGDEYRKPKDHNEIKKSRKSLRKIDHLNVQSKQVKERMDELENVLDSRAEEIPDYGRRMTRSLFWSLVALAGLIVVLSWNTFYEPDINYEEEQYTTIKPGFLYWDSYKDDETGKTFGMKLRIPTGSKLKPMGIEPPWVLAETEDGQRGYVNIDILEAGKHVQSDDNAKFLPTINAKEGDTLEPETNAVILAKKTVKNGKYSSHYYKLRLDDGRTGWGQTYDFDWQAENNIPNINGSYSFPVDFSKMDKRILGHNLKEIEDHYGMAVSHIKNNEKNEAYLHHITMVEGRNHYNGLMLEMDENDVVTGYRYDDEAYTKFFDRFPLMDNIRKLEASVVLGSSFYKGESWIDFGWWDSFKDMNWFTLIVGWIIQILIGLLLIFLIFSLPRLIIGPIMLLICFARFFSNGAVLFLNFVIYIFATYLFFLIMTLVMDQWLIAAIFSLLAFFFWFARHRSNIHYNRCPNCHLMYAALSEGSSYQGRTKHVTWSTYDVYKGTSTSSTTRTRHYERRDKKDVKLVDHYLDHQTCSSCGYHWDIKRKETAEEYTKKY